MTNSKKRTLIYSIVGGTAVVLYLIFGVTLPRLRKPDADNSRPDVPNPIILANLSPTAIASLTIRNGAGETLTLEAGGPASSPVFTIKNESNTLNADAISAVTNVFNPLRASAAITKTQDLGAFGLAPPRITARVIARPGVTEGRTFGLNIGYSVPSGSGNYAAVEGSDEVYIVSGYTAATLNKSLDDFIDTSLPPVDFSSPASLKLTNRHDVVTVVPGGGVNGVSSFRFESPLRFAGRDVDQAVWTEFFRPWHERSPFSMRVPIAHPGSLSRYGLDRPAATMSLTDKKGETLTLWLGSRSESGDYYAKVPNLEPVFRMDGDLAESLMNTTAFQLVDKFVYLSKLSDLKSFSWRAPEQDALVTVSKASGDNLLFTINGKPLPDKAARDLYQAFVSIFIEGEIASTAPRGAALYAQTYLGSGAPLTAEYFPLDADFYAVVINGKPTGMKVGKSQLASLAATVAPLLK